MAFILQQAAENFEVLWTERNLLTVTNQPVLFGIKHIFTEMVGCDMRPHNNLS
jgi:hypothetical protein